MFLFLLILCISAGYANNNNKEIYTDIRVEADKKNLLTLPTDPNKMYIKSGSSRPSAEVIVYPMGQLLNPPRSQVYS